MKHYEKTYEDVYSDARAQRVCNLGDISNAIGLTNTEFIELTRNEWKSAYADFFEHALRLMWIASKYCYKDRKREHNKKPPLWDDFAYASFLNILVGTGNKGYRTADMFGKIAHYIDELYPEFDERSPIEDPEYYKFPYSYITLEYMVLVYQMPERMELLDYAEKNMMPYAVFADYVINYILNFNEEAGEDLYIFIKVAKTFPYVKYIYHPVYAHRGKKKKKKRS